jgi:PAS domain S-box-containing protein
MELMIALAVVLVAAAVAWGMHKKEIRRLNTERAQAHQQASAQREWLRVALLGCGDAVITTDAAGNVRLVNPAAEALVGRSSGQLVDRPIDEAFPLTEEKTGRPAEHPLRSVLRSDAGTAGGSEFLLQCAGDTTRLVALNVAPTRSEDGSLIGAVMVLHPVDTQRESEQAMREAYAELDGRVADRTEALERANAALHESLALFRGVAESTPDLIYVKDREGRLVMANPATIKAIGKAESEILGRTDLEFMPDQEQAARVMENDRHVMSSGRVERIEEVIGTPEGPRTYLATKSPLRDVHGQAIGLIAVGTDITDRKRMENELREAQRFTQGLLETAPIILYLFDLAQRRIVYASGMGLTSLGYAPSDLMMTTDETLAARVHPDDLPHLQDHLRRYRESHTGLREVQFRYRHRNGEWRWLHSRERLFEPEAGGRLALGVAVDITEHKQAELEREELVSAEKQLRLEAERANRAKDEFLAIVSHELRSPLNAMRGWGFLLGNAKPLEPALVERATQAIKRNVDHQARLIDDLLDTSRIMSGKLNIERRPVNLVEIVGNALDVVRPSSLAKRISLQFASDPAGVAIEGDAARLHQIVINLLSNAVKFTQEGGEVNVSVREAGGLAILSVTDTGVGIAPEFVPYVFERFSQEDTSTTRKQGGLGIGLALVRHLAELHGGKAMVESAGPGKGATFTVEFPLPAADSAGLDSAPPPEARVLDPHGLSGTRICALDDDPDARDVIGLTLRQAGAEVRTVSSGTELIAMLEDQLPGRRPDVLLMDLAMPNEDGFAVLARVRAVEGRKSIPPDGAIPAIAVTAFTEINRTRVIERGFVDHVSKPIDAAKLVASIKRALAARKSPVPEKTAQSVSP